MQKIRHFNEGQLNSANASYWVYGDGFGLWLWCNDIVTFQGGSILTLYSKINLNKNDSRVRASKEPWEEK